MNIGTDKASKYGNLMPSISGIGQVPEWGPGGCLSMARFQIWQSNYWLWSILIGPDGECQISIFAILESALRNMEKCAKIRQEKALQGCGNS
jgi:hypothetical protein